MAVRERLQIEEHNFFSDSICRPVPRWDHRIIENMRRNNDTSAECMSYAWHRKDVLFNYYDARSITY
jgi:hypothetical protein